MLMSGQILCHIRPELAPGAWVPLAPGTLKRSGSHYYDLAPLLISDPVEPAGAST